MPVEILVNKSKYPLLQLSIVSHNVVSGVLQYQTRMIISFDMSDKCFAYPINVLHRLVQEMCFLII